jgi:hypothetical protein
VSAIADAIEGREVALVARDRLAVDDAESLADGQGAPTADI